MEIKQNNNSAKKINIAIDGFSACGKSSTAKEVAKKLQYTYIDTGAMYRAVTYYFIKNNIDFDNTIDVENALQNITIHFEKCENSTNDCTFLNSENVENEIRKSSVAAKVSEVAAISLVRKKLVEQQQQLGKNKGFVMDGRDIGTVVFPDAELKYFMTANYDIRTQRRQKELFEKQQIMEDLDLIKANLLHRDTIDSSREDSPLQQAKDAIIMDTTNLTLPLQIDIIYNKALEILNK